MSESDKALIRFLETRDKVVIAGHRNPDGDCLGVMSALWQLRSDWGRSTVLISRDSIPDHLNFLPGMDRVQVCEKWDCEGIDVVLLECGTPARCGIGLVNPGCFVNIDHHPDNEQYGDVRLLNSEASSIGEMITLLLDKWEEMKWSVGIADALYTAIHTDTGGFSYNNTSVNALEAAVVLARNGAQIGSVCTKIYQEQALKRLRLLGRYLTSLYTHLDNRFGVGVIRQKDLKACGCTAADTDNFSAYPRNIAGVWVGMFLLEKPDGTYKVSLRSKGKLPVNAVAAEFGGGGHSNAAGCTMEGDPDSIVARLVRELKRHESE